MNDYKLLLSLPEDHVVVSSNTKYTSGLENYNDKYLTKNLIINEADSGSRIPFKMIKVLKIREIEDIHVLENSMILDDHAHETLAQYTAFDHVGDVTVEGEHIQTIVSKIMSEADGSIDSTCILYFNSSFFWVEVATVVRAVDVGLEMVLKHRDGRTKLALWDPDDGACGYDEKEDEVEPPKFFLHDNLLGEQAI